MRLVFSDSRLTDCFDLPHALHVTEANRAVPDPRQFS
jgi:hypothetical protein